MNRGPRPGSGNFNNQVSRGRPESPAQLEAKRLVSEVIGALRNVTRLQDFDTAHMVSLADKLGKALGKDGANLKTNQIRKFLDALVRLHTEMRPENFSRDPIVLLKPKLAYAAGRNRDQVGPLQEVLDPCLDRVQTYQDFVKLFRFVEAIVAYHRFYGGKEN